jgi:hypothetical protein
MDVGGRDDRGGIDDAASGLAERDARRVAAVAAALRGRQPSLYELAADVTLVGPEKSPEQRFDNS